MKIGRLLLVLAVLGLLLPPAPVGASTGGPATGLPASLLALPQAASALAEERAEYLEIGGQRFLRREARANSFTPGQQGGPALALDPAGELIVAWQSRRQEAPGYDIYAQRFDPLGRRLGAETRLNATLRSDQTAPALLCGADGRPLASWASFGQDGSQGAVVLRPFGAGLLPRAGESVINEQAAGDQAEAAIALGAEGEALLAWSGPENGRGLTRAWGRWFAAGGEPLGPEFRLGQPELAGERFPSPVFLPGGGAVAYAALDESGRPAGIWCRPLGGRGEALGDPLRLDDHPCLYAIEPSLTAGPDGRILATWLEYIDEQAAFDVRARLLDRDGRPLAPSFAVHEECAGVQDGPAAAFAPDGRLVILWNHFRGGEEGCELMARFYGAAGQPLGEAFRLTAASAGDQRLAEATARARAGFGPAGQLVVAWEGKDEALGDEKGVFLTLLLPATDERLAGDLDGDGLLTAADGALLADVLSGADADPRQYLRADLDRDGRAGIADLALFTPGLDESDLRRVREAEAYRAGVAAAREQREERRSAEARLARLGQPLTISATEEAKPHEPPVRDLSYAGPLDPWGGDADPVPLADAGFLGVLNTGWYPPDPHLAVGPSHVVVMTNGAIAFYTKAGFQTFQDEIEDSYGFWGGLGATGFVFDPEVIYDPHSGRFMAMACERTDSGGSGLSYFLLAVSDNSDPNGTWYKYRLNVTTLAGAGNIDSPNIAVDAQAIYLSADFWVPTERYFIYILEKAPLLSGGSLGITRSLTINGTQSHGMAVTYGTAPALYMIEHFEASSNTTVRLHAITNPLGTPARVTYTLTVPSYSPPEDPPQLGTSTRPETFDARFWSCVWRAGSLWACHHIGSSRVLARWYQVNTANWPTSGTPSLVQSGNVDPGSTVRTFFNAISADDEGNAVMCFARSSPTEYISMARAARCASDPAGTLPDLFTQKASTAGSTTGRWGDYSGVGVDPVDGRTFWMAHEYAPSSSSWNMWIASLDPECAPPDTLSVDLGCFPASGTLPFTVTLLASLENLSAYSRVAAGRMDIHLAGGGTITNYRSGYTSLSPAEVFSTNWNQNLPAYGALVGNNVFTLLGMDVTPSPFNQPPYPASGDTGTTACTVTGQAP